MTNLHDDVKELEKAVKQQFNPKEGEENERSEPDETEGSERSSSAEHETETGLEEPASKRGRDGERARGRGRNERGHGAGNRKASDETSQGSDEDAPEDGETSRRTGAGASRDGGSPRSDARSADGRTKADGLLKEDNQPTDHAGAARLRRELREAKAKLREMEEAKAVPATDVAAQVQEKPVVDQEPDKATNPQAWNEWRIRSLEKTIETKLAPIEKNYQQTEEQRTANERISGAVNEFKQIRDNYIKENPDFVPAFTHSYNKMTEAMALMNPGWSKEQVIKEADWQMLQFSANCAKKGVNPAEAIYDLCIERFGWKPGQAEAKPSKRAAVEPEDEHEEQETPVRERPKTDLRTIDRNRKRSVTPLSRGGQSGSSRLTKEAIADMPLGEMLNLEASDWDALERLGS